MYSLVDDRTKINSTIFIRILIILAIQIFFLEYSFRNVQPLDTSASYIVIILSLLGFVSCLFVFRAGRSGFLSLPYNIALMGFDTAYVCSLFVATGGVYSPFVLLIPVYIIGSSFLLGGVGNALAIGLSSAMIFTDYFLFRNKNFIFSISIFMMLVIFGFVTRYFMSNFSGTKKKILSLEKELEESQKLKIVTPIAAILAHEIKNPVASMRGAVDMLGYDLKNEDREKLFNLIRRESDRLVHLADDFLAYSSPEKRTEEVIDLNLMISQISESVKMHADFGVKDLKFKLNLAANIFARGDFVRLSQVVENLMINAMHASEAGSEISCSLAEENGSVVITVSDTGKGIADSIKNKIFEPFFTTKQKGTGLGLAIARRIIEAHNGSISVTSTGSGAEFKITLPKFN